MIGTGFFTILGLVYIAPILVVLMNSFKKKVYINKEPFILPNEKTWNSIENYVTAIDKYELLDAVGWTVFITVGSVLVILVCTSMCAWYITRVKTKFTKALYLLCVFSMVVPFQMVMFTLSLDGGPDQAEYSVGDYDYISGIWSRTGSFYVLRFCEVHSAGNRGSSNDRRLYAASHIFQCGASDYEAHLYFRGNSGDDVDME